MNAKTGVSEKVTMTRIVPIEMSAKMFFFQTQVKLKSMKVIAEFHF